MHAVAVGYGEAFRRGGFGGRDRGLGLRGGPRIWPGTAPARQ